MNILVYDFLGSFIQKDLTEAVRAAGHKVKEAVIRPLDKYSDEKTEKDVCAEIKSGGFDLVLTTNFLPLLAKVCNKVSVPYVSWVYDSPPELPTLQYMDCPGNRIYFFSRHDHETYKNMGLESVYYLPLAVNTERLDRCRADKRFEADVSFVGKMYEPVLPTLKSCMSEYQKGYIEAVVNVQEKLYGVDLFNMMIDENFADSVCKEYKSRGVKDIEPNARQLRWAVAEYVSCLDRINLLNVMSERYDTRLYTGSISDAMRSNLRKVDVREPIDYLTEMPLVFKSTDINLCPIIRANVTGIPLRALDIMGCNAFMISSYQPELAEYFVPGEEVVMYASIEEAVELADYYFKHEEERKQIAKRAYEIVRKNFNYAGRVGKLLSDVK
ncbi:MAG: glycosyltransferase [Lachnospiraceae bacterium]|nr:glycosyltransferase [Lachnospiraceae bacterium]